MRFLITGGSGFIGSHLVETLVARGDKVVIIDNQSTGSIKNLQKIESKVKFIAGDILDKALLKYSKGKSLVQGWLSAKLISEFIGIMI